MRAAQGNLIGSATSLYARAKVSLERTSAFFSQVTFNIKRGTPAETVAELEKRWTLNEKNKEFLLELASTKSGAAFIDEKVEAINRGAFHRSAFALNAFTQLGFVDLAAQISLSSPELKIALVLANLLIAFSAHLEMRAGYRALLAGPNPLPSKRRLGGLLSNPAYNKAVKKKSRPYAKMAWREKNVYRSSYFINALTIFLGSQFIIPPGKIIFPIGFLLGKASGLFSTLIMVFDVWRGIRAGDDARIAREKEVSVYRHLDI